MSEQASAVIKLTKSEIEYTIIALVLAEETSFTLSQTDYGNMFNKLRKDFISENFLNSGMSVNFEIVFSSAE